MSNLTEGDGKIQELMTISSRKNVGKIIAAKNYVGVIAMTDGTVIEILPKINGEQVSKEESKKIFLEMLKTSNLINYKIFNTTQLNTNSMNILEIFIKMFVDEVDILCKQGLKSAYISKQENEQFFRGKLLVNENIKYNRINKEHFFVSYDEFGLNRPENRLIKSTLEMLMKMSRNPNSIKLIRQLLGQFESIAKSSNYTSDFSMCQTDRSMDRYIKALAWSKVFLMKKSFTSFSGDNIAFSLLFPMEKLFESYIAHKLKQHLESGIKLSVQEKKYHMFDDPKPIFSLKPDIVIRSGESTFVLDTKWKILNETDKNFGISQNDIYQMYAYSKKYNSKRSILIFPRQTEKSISHHLKSSDEVHVLIYAVDLKYIDQSIRDLMNRISEE